MQRVRARRQAGAAGLKAGSGTGTIEGRTGDGGMAGFGGQVLVQLLRPPAASGSFMSHCRSQSKGWR